MHLITKQGAQRTSGNWITGHQTRILMQSKQKGNSQKVATAQASFSERSGYNVNNRTSKSLRNQERWKTRSDPFSKVWEEELVPLLETSPKLEARTLLEYLQMIYEGQYPDELLRTLQLDFAKF